MSSQLKLSAYGALATLATATSLSAVYVGSGWIIPIFGAVILVVGACAAVRASPLPSAFEPIVAAIAVVIWLTILDAHSKAHFDVIPGRLAFRHLGKVASGGFTEIHRLPTPAPTRHGLLLLTVVGVAAIALVVDLLTVTLRRAALSGLPLLALFTVSAATAHKGVSLLDFLLAAVGYLWLLYADNREKVARWGAAVGTGSKARPASAWLSTDAVAAPSPATLGRQVAAVALSLGVVVPVLIPGLHTGIDRHSNGSGAGSGTGSGGGSVHTFDPIVRVGAYLRSSAPTQLLTYRTSTPDPGYLRLTSLDIFNGKSFTSGTLREPSGSSASERLPVPQPSGPTISTTVTVSSQFMVHWLPVQTRALGVSVGNGWRYDPSSATVFSATTTTAGLAYTERSVSTTPSAAALAAAPPPATALDVDMSVPKSLSSQVKALTGRVTAGASSQYAKALDIQRFLTSRHFTYDTSIPRDNSPDALASFLLDTRRGFCQQFASAMAVMARLSGIPSRVAVGFTRGTQRSDGSWVVTTHDAHAWPELWFQGFGWLPFEPTPRADGQALDPAYAQTAPSKTHPTGPRAHHGGTKGGSAAPKGLPLKLSPEERDTNGGGTAPVGPLNLPSHSTPLRDWLLLALAILLAAGLIVPSVGRVLIRQWRWRRMRAPNHACEAAWAELRDTAIDARSPWDDGRSPRQIIAQLGDSFGPAITTRESLLRLASAEERSRYAASSTVNARDVRNDVATIRRAARLSRSPGQRLAMVVLPRSTMRATLAGLGRLADALSHSWFSVRRRVPERLRPSDARVQM
jgi:hypothetical protein